MNAELRLSESWRQPVPQVQGRLRRKSAAEFSTTDAGTLVSRKELKPRDRAWPESAAHVRSITRLTGAVHPLV
jgi:hypothetical protein